MQIRPLSKALQGVAERELNEVQCEIDAKLEHLRDWINKQPHLKCRLEDQWLVAFLRGSKYSLQKAKEKLECYHSARTIFPEFFRDRNAIVEEAEKYFKHGFLLRYSAPAEEETPIPIVSIFRVNGLSVDKFPFNTLFTFGFMLADLTIYTDDRYTIAGEQILVDLKGLNSSMITQVTPVNMRKAVHCLFKAYPLRFKAICCINSSQIFVNIFNATKALMPEKIRKRIHIYGDTNFEEVYKIIPRYTLPKEYGGDAGTIEELSAKMCKHFQAHKDWYIEDAQYGTDESKRTEPLENYGIYGAEGSFRQLSVD